MWADKNCVCDLELIHPHTQTSKKRSTQSVVRLQVLVGQFEEALDSFQRHFGLQDAVEHPGEGVEWDDQHSHQSQRGEHLQERTVTAESSNITTTCKDRKIQAASSSYNNFWCSKKTVVAAIRNVNWQQPLINSRWHLVILEWHRLFLSFYFEKNSCQTEQHWKVTFQIIRQRFPTLAAVSWCPSSTYVMKVRMEMTTGRAAQV